MKPIKVLSLFDGMSGTMLALKDLGIEVDTYYASEIDKYAEAESAANFPEIVRLGDVTQWQSWNIPWGEIDLLVGGFPCQNWSNAGNQTGVQGVSGRLFLTLIDIWTHMKEMNPDLLYLFENVKMKDDFKDYISATIGSEPFFLNSCDFTAQYRQRYYWCNWFVPAPLCTGPSLQSILESGYTDRNKSYCLDANYFKGGDCNQYFNKSRRQMVFFQQPIDKEWLLEHGKHKVHYRKLTVKECCRLQGIPDNYIKVSSDTQAYKMIGNGFTIPVISYILTHGLGNKKP